VIGPNGAGKSTLFRMIKARKSPIAAKSSSAPPSRSPPSNQTREGLDDSKTVFEAIADGADILTVGKFEMPSRAYIGRFNFKGGDQPRSSASSPVVSAAACIWPRPWSKAATCCCSTSPQTIWTWKPCAPWKTPCWNSPAARMVTSHDRWFLDRIATHILACEGESQWTFFAGNYTEYEEDKKKRLGEEGAKPKRIRYKPIAR
jgi:sulfate-transporting ATPase